MLQTGSERISQKLIQFASTVINPLSSHSACGVENRTRSQDRTKPATVSSRCVIASANTNDSSEMTCSNAAVGCP
ncbi:MAG TPA: hypothetical protein VG387_08980 [Rhizomicrobium sp.]|jgi:hypothetical protein|nr:hypothetical protein [Rhizomicrobium sp.]